MGVSPLPATGQEQAGSTVIYDAAYFEQFTPVTLEDMFRTIPGGNQVLSSLRFRGGADGNRGFGASDAPILIDGRRMSGKSNDMATTLARIQASQVERIELIRGNAEGLDIRSEGTLYNVILKQEARNTSTNFLDLTFKYLRQVPFQPGILVSHSGKRGALEYGLSYKFDRGPRVTNINEDVFDPGGVPEQLRLLTDKNRNDKHIFTGNLGYDFQSGIRVRLNGLYSDNLRRQKRNEDQLLLGDGGSQTLIGVEDSLFRFTNTEWEVGGDIESDIGRIGHLKALFVVNRKVHDDDITQDLIEGDLTTRFFTSVADFDQGETIFRLSMTSTFGDRHTLEYGGEGAFNTLDRTFAFDDDPLQNAVVTEDRYEVFATHSFKISDKVELQSALTGEFSTISQNRDGIANSRSFEFLKPRFELRYDLTNADQFRLVANRTVSQLNLNDFVAKRVVEDDSIDFGNPNLSPEQTWRYSLGYEKRFANDGGSLDIELFYERISDHIDKILIGEASSGVGNIGKAWKRGIEVEASIRMGFLNFPNAVLTLTYRHIDSKATDPFTGAAREVRGATPHFASFDFRHDIRNSKFSYGFGGHRRSTMRRTDVFLQEVRTFRRHVEAFFEYSLTDRIKLTFDSHRFLHDTSGTNKTFFVGNIADGVVDRIEKRLSKVNVLYTFRLQATF